MSIFVRIPGTGYVSASIILVSMCALILMALYRCQGTTITAKKTNCMPHNAALTCSPYNHTNRWTPQRRGGRAYRTPLPPLGKLHRHVVPGMKYDACVVPGISWSFGKRVLVSFYRFVFSLSFSRFRYRYTEIVSVRYFLSYRFLTIIPKLSVRYPFLLFSCPRFWLSLYVQILLKYHHPHTIGSP